MNRKAPETLLSRRLRGLTHLLARADVDTRGLLFGGEDGYGADFSNKLFTMRRHTENPAECSCGNESPNPSACARTCASNLPNFKCGHFEVRWHKYIGRSMEVSGPELSDADIDMLFDWCESSIRGGGG